MYVALLLYPFDSFPLLLTQAFVKIIAQFSTCTSETLRMQEVSSHFISQPSSMISIEVTFHDQDVPRWSLLQPYRRRAAWSWHHIVSRCICPDQD